MFKINHILLLVCILFSTHAVANIDGVVQRVVDGDTIHVETVDGKKYKVRLLGIDAPELLQPYGMASKKNLKDLIQGRNVKIITNKKDRYKRVLGKILLEKKDINLIMVRQGFAWHYKRYIKDQAKNDVSLYSIAQDFAEDQQLGLWKEPISIPPWDWRRNNRGK
mgnify:FL=1|tara:strand:- start:295 stop:789 length:495 start_codon:yes stop_codon:yes gene_type:complete